MRCRSCAPLPEEVRRVADLLERRWTVSILYVSHEGAVRFNEFQQALGSIPPAPLAQRLGDLQQAGILKTAGNDPRPPPRIDPLPRGRPPPPSVLVVGLRFSES